MPVTTRQKILDYLKRNRTVSSREIAHALRMTPANARYHLGILAADGRVELINQRQVGRGRPEKVYQLSGTLVGNNLSALADALLVEAGDGLRMEAVGKRLAEERSVEGHSLMRRLAFTVERLNEMHYQARWEAGAEGPRIVLGHCPYASVIGKHPELCQMDSALLEEFLGGQVQQVAKLERGAGETTFCLFLIE